MKKLAVLVVALSACGGGSGGHDMAITEYDFAQRTYDFASEHEDIARSTDLSRTILATDMGNATTPPTTGTDSSGNAIPSALGSLIGSLLGALLDSSGKSSMGSASGGGTLTCPSGLDVYGYCYNNAAVWCDNGGTADAEDCGSEGTVCSYACPGATGYASCCAPAGNVSSCVEGCKGTKLTYCDNNTATTYDCATNTDGNTACGLDSDGYMSCIQGMGGACDGQSYDGLTYYGLTYQGACDGDIVVFCDMSSTLQTIDCSTSSQTCSWINDTVGYSCQ